MSHAVETFLLIGGLNYGNHRELPVKTGILLILRRMHRRIIRGDDDYSAVDTGNGGVHERVGTYVHSHMFHADHGTFARVRHS